MAVFAAGGKQGSGGRVNMAGGAVTRRQALRGIALASLAGGANFAYGEGARWLPWPAKRTAPQLVLTDVDGKPWDLAQQTGKPLLLNFWATWCEPCRAEMQSFVALEKQLSDRDLQVVTVNFKESADAVRRFRDTNGLPFVWLRDSYGEAASAWGVHTFPTSVLIDRKGRALLSVVGEVDWAAAAAHKGIAALL